MGTEPLIFFQGISFVQCTVSNMAQDIALSTWCKISSCKNLTVNLKRIAVSGIVERDQKYPKPKSEAGSLIRQTAGIRDHEFGIRSKQEKASFARSWSLRRLPRASLNEVQCDVVDGDRGRSS